MKRILIMIISLCLMLSLTVQAFAVENKVTENGFEYAAHQLIVDTEYLVDTSLYDGTEAKDFHGIPVKTIESLVKFHDPNEWLDKFGYMVYVIVLDESVDELEAIEVLKTKNGVKNATLNYAVYPANDAIGDVNCNGKLDARDYLLLKRAYFGTYELGCDFEVADINGNGKLDARDYLLLKRAYFGTYTLGAPDSTPDEA